MPKRKSKVAEFKAKGSAKSKVSAKPKTRRLSAADMYAKTVGIVKHEATGVMGLAEEMRRIAEMAKKPEIKDALAAALADAKAIAKQLGAAVKGA